jgi:hypothetical protein
MEQKHAENEGLRAAAVEAVAQPASDPHKKSVHTGHLLLQGIFCKYRLADFGPAELDMIDAQAAAVWTEPTNAEVPLTNPEDVAGRVAVVSRGGGKLYEKVVHCRAAGAVAVIIVNSEDKHRLSTPKMTEGVQVEGGEAALLPTVMVPAEMVRRMADNSICVVDRYPNGELAPSGAPPTRGSLHTPAHA